MMTSYRYRVISAVSGLVIGGLLAIGAHANAAPINAKLGRKLGGQVDPKYNAAQRNTIRRQFRGKAAAGQVSINGVNYLSDQHYNHVRDMGLSLLRRHPPSKNYYVAVGRSPSSLVAFLRQLNEHMAMTFPASDLRLSVQPQWKAAFFDHFKKLIPKDVLHGNGSIVLFDRSHNQSGSTLEKLKGFLTEYLQSIGSPAKVKAVGLAQQGPLRPGVEHLDTSAHPSVFLYQNGRDYDEVVAPFKDKHQIGNQPLEQVKINPAYDQLTTAMRNRIEADPQLDQVLSKEFGKVLSKPGSGQATAARPKTSKKPAAPKSSGKSTLAQRWGIQPLYNAALPQLSGKQLKVRRTVKGKKHSYTLLDAKEYAAYSKVAQRLLKDNPPDQGAIYVGVGRTSSPVLAILETLDATRTSYLPIDNASTVGGSNQAEIDQIIGAYLNTSALKKGSSVVLFQRGDGKGLAKVAATVQVALKNAGHQVKVKSVALSEVNTPRSVARIDISKDKPLLALGSGAIKAVAPITRHHVGKHPLPSGNQRPKYGKLVSAIRQFVERDTDLDRLLQK